VSEAKNGGLVLALIVGRQIEAELVTRLEATRVGDEGDAVADGLAGRHGVEAPAREGGAAGLALGLLHRSQAGTKVSARDVSLPAGVVEILQDDDERRVEGGRRSVELELDGPDDLEISLERRGVPRQALNL
jgi:hypothetical protein